MTTTPRGGSQRGAQRSVPFTSLLWIACALACAHSASPAPIPDAPFKPQPDAAIVREAVEAEQPKANESFEAQPYVSARAYSHLLAALLASQNESYAKACDELREALLYDPESPHLHTLLADALVHLGRIGDADEELRAALGADETHGPAHLLAARIAAARGHAGEARGHLRAAIAANGEDPSFYRELIHLEAQQSDPEAAERVATELETIVHSVNLRSQIAERAEAFAASNPNAVEPDAEGALLASSIRLREECGRAWEEVARAFAEKHDEAGAEAAFGRAEAVDPGGLEQVAAHALFLETRRRFAEARNEELKLLARRPEAPEVLAALCRLALEAGDAESSEAYLAKLIDLASELAEAGTARAAQSEPSERVEARHEVAVALLRAGLPLLGARRPAAAAPAFDAALRLLPDQPELLFYRALGLEGRGRPREAAQLLTEVASQLAIHPGNSLLGVEPAALALDARVQAALAKGRAGDLAISLRELHAIFAQHPLDEGAALGLLEGFDRAGKAAEAIPLFETALVDNPINQTLLFALASAQDRAQKPELALQTMRRLLARAPDHAGALNYVGYALVEKGGQANLEEASRLLEHAIELRPDDGAIADSYGLCLLKLGHPREALVELRRADALTPGDPVVLGHLGDALLATGARASAEEAFRHALERLEPRPPKPALHHGRAAARTSASNMGDEPLEDRAPEANDSRVKAELLEKLRALTAP